MHPATLWHLFSLPPLSHLWRVAVLFLSNLDRVLHTMARGSWQAIQNGALLLAAGLVACTVAMQSAQNPFGNLWATSSQVQVQMPTTVTRTFAANVQGAQLRGPQSTTMPDSGVAHDPSNTQGHQTSVQPMRQYQFAALDFWGWGAVLAAVTALAVWARSIGSKGSAALAAQRVSYPMSMVSVASMSREGF